MMMTHDGDGDGDKDDDYDNDGNDNHDDGDYWNIALDISCSLCQRYVLSNRVMKPFLRPNKCLFERMLSLRYRETNSKYIPDFLSVQLYRHWCDVM